MVLAISQGGELQVYDVMNFMVTAGDALYGCREKFRICCFIVVNDKD